VHAPRRRNQACSAVVHALVRGCICVQFYIAHTRAYPGELVECLATHHTLQVSSRDLARHTIVSPVPACFASGIYQGHVIGCYIGKWPSAADVTVTATMRPSVLWACCDCDSVRYHDPVELTPSTLGLHQAQHAQRMMRVTCSTKRPRRMSASPHTKVSWFPTTCSPRLSQVVPI
jgi:hypothetical protein